MIAVPKRLPPYQPLGDLRLGFPGHDQAENYRRGSSTWTPRSCGSPTGWEAATFQREVFASAVDHVLVVRLTCDRPGRLTFSATLDRKRDATTEAKSPDRVLLRGEAIARDDRHVDERKVGVKFSALLRVAVEGGVFLPKEPGRGACRKCCDTPAGCGHRLSVRGPGRRLRAGPGSRPTAL